MNKAQRFQEIVDIVNMEGKISVNDLSDIFKVTPETIRRDLDEIQNLKLITRIHGAAIPYVQPEAEMIFEKKMNQHRQLKERICHQALQFINDSDLIAVDVGTTTVHLGDQIEGVKDLTVVTNSLASALSFNQAIEEGRITGQVIILPGYTNPPQASIKGSYTVEFLRKFHINKAFISCGGLTNQSIYDFDIDETMVSLTMIENSEKSYLLTDSSKINHRRMFEIAPTDSVDYILCDQKKPHNWDIRPQWIQVSDH